MKIVKLKNYKKTFFVIKIENDDDKEFLNEICIHSESLQIKQYNVWKNHFLIKFSGKITEEKNFDKTYRGGIEFKITTDFVQKKAKVAILETLKSMKIEPKKEQTEFDDDYYLNFSPENVLIEKDNIEPLKELVYKIKYAAKNNEIPLCLKLSEEYEPALRTLIKNGFTVEYSNIQKECITNKIHFIIRIWWQH